MNFIKHIFKLSILLAFSCNQQEIVTNNIGQSSSNREVKRPIVILIQPFNDLPLKYINSVETELKKIYSKVEIKAPIQLPLKAINQSKTRYRADSLIRFLSEHTSTGYLTIGLTTRDISTTKGKFPDWGVMGLGYCPGKSCIASSFRLKGSNKLVKLYKVAIHELGHTQGLKHCPVKTCLMRDAKGKDHLNEEVEFCYNCKRILIKAGWDLK
jgi:archaemetzincin